MSAPLFSALRNPRFLKLWAGQCISALGDRFTQMALLSLVMAGQASDEQAKIILYEFLPWIILGPFAGVLVDRYSRKWLMIGADLVRGLLVALIFIVLMAHKGSGISAVYPLLFAMGSMTAIFSPAKSAALPDLVDSREILPSGALLSATGVISTAVGGILAGWVIDHWGVRACLMLDAFSFVLSAVAVAWIAFPPRQEKPRLQFKDVVKDLGGGFREIRHNGELLKICAFLFVFWFASISIQVIAPNYGKEVLGLGGRNMTELGQILALAGLGLLVGAGATAFAGHRVARRAAYCFASAGMGGAVLALASCRSFPSALACLFLAGFAGGTMVSRIDADILKVISPDIRGRVFGATSVIFAAAMLTPLLPIGWLSVRMPAVQILRLLAMGLLALGAWVLLRLLKDLKAGKPLLLPVEGKP